MSSDKEKESKSKLEDIAIKATKEGIKAGIKVTKFIKNTIDEVKEKRDATYNQNKKGKALVQEEYKPVKSRSGTPVYALERQIEVWQGWFWGTVVYIFIIIVSFMIATSDPRFRLLPWVLVVGFPFYLIKAIINSIPEIKIGNTVILSRKDISIRDQLSFSSTVVRMFSTELYRKNPKGAAILTIFILILLYILISPFFG